MYTPAYTIEAGMFTIHSPTIKSKFRNHEPHTCKRNKWHKIILYLLIIVEKPTGSPRISILNATNAYYYDTITLTIYSSAPLANPLMRTVQFFAVASLPVVPILPR